VASHEGGSAGGAPTEVAGDLWRFPHMVGTVGSGLWRATGSSCLRRLAASLMSGEDGGRASQNCDMGGGGLLMGVGPRSQPFPD
jgi:hypothetical protein